MLTLPLTMLNTSPALFCMPSSLFALSAIFLSSSSSLAGSRLFSRCFSSSFWSQIDPQGIELRRKRRLRRRIYSIKGPNSVWHIDCYDKLSRYGIKIHGCIDGFSRQIIWLKQVFPIKIQTLLLIII